MQILQTLAVQLFLSVGRYPKAAPICLDEMGEMGRDRDLLGGGGVRAHF